MLRIFTPPHDIKICIYYSLDDDSKIIIDEDTMRNEFEQKLEEIAKRYNNKRGE
jgi:hypothetical protein